MSALKSVPLTAETVLFAWIALWSFVAVIVTVSDKVRAKRGAWRIPENALLAVSALGGSAAMLLTMLIIRHKTRHPRFMIGIPLMLALQIPLAIGYYTL